MRTSTFQFRGTACNIRGAAIGVFAALLGFSIPGFAADANAETCLQITDISTTKVVDDQTILFKTRGNHWYKNQLPHKCPGLKSNDKFLYKTSLSKLCNVDMITVLISSGSSMMQGASCGLGLFTPTDDPAKKPKDSE